MTGRRTVELSKAFFNCSDSWFDGLPMMGANPLGPGSRGCESPIERVSVQFARLFTLYTVEAALRHGHGQGHGGSRGLLRPMSFPRVLKPARCVHMPSTAHWETRLLADELMSYGGGAVVSSFSLALLEDLGCAGAPPGTPNQLISAPVCFV